MVAKHACLGKRLGWRTKEKSLNIMQLDYKGMNGTSVGWKMEGRQKNALVADSGI